MPLRLELPSLDHHVELFLHFPEYGSYFNKIDNVKLNP